MTVKELYECLKRKIEEGHADKEILFMKHLSDERQYSISSVDIGTSMNLLRCDDECEEDKSCEDCENLKEVLILN